MKKLLTVLLAMALICTYSIPAVFADTTSAVQAEQDCITAQEAALATALGTYSSAVTYNGNSNLVSAPAVKTVDSNLTKAAVEAGIAELKTEYNLAIETAAAKAVADGTFDADDAKAVAESWTKVVGTNDLIGAELFKAGTKSYTAMYAKAVTDAKAAAQAVMDSYDPSLYGSEDAATIKNAKVDEINATASVSNDEAGLKAVLAAKDAFATAVKDLVKSADTATTLAKYKTAAKAAIEDAATKFAPTETAALRKIIDTTTNDATVIADAQSQLNNLSANIAAVEAYYENQIDAVTTDSQKLAKAKEAIDALATAGTGAFKDDASFATARGLVATKDLLLKYAQDYAASLKTAYDKTTGLATYNESTVDSALKSVTALINAGKDPQTYALIQKWFADNCATAAAEKENLTKIYKPYAIELITMDKTAYTYATGKTTTAITGDDKYDSDYTSLKGQYNKLDWDADYQDAIAAIQDEYTTKINAAATKDAVIALVKEAQAKIDAVALNATDTATVKTQIAKNMGTLNYAAQTTAADGTNGTIQAYADAKNVTKAYSAATMAAAEKAAAKVLYDAVLAQKNTHMTDAQVQQILKDNYTAALAKIDAMKTAAEMSTAANAVVAAIAALPTNATLADKAKYLAVEKQYEDYLALTGAQKEDITNRGLLQAYMTKIVGLEKASAEALIAALPTNITLADQKAVEAARAAVDAYDKAYSGYTADPTNYFYTKVNNLGTLTTAESKLSDAKLTDAAKKIAALPETITMADADAVKAAQAAYDNLSDSEKAAFSTTLYNKLVAAQKALTEAQISATQSLKLTAKSAAVKGKMTITWKVKGTVITGVKYQVMRSQHKNFGYKYMKTTSMKKYVNTKNLKAGKVYYYKVRAFVTVDGVKYFSDWSNKAFRTAK